MVKRRIKISTTIYQEKLEEERCIGVISEQSYNAHNDKPINSVYCDVANVTIDVCVSQSSN
jgi:hypothetical protein